MDLSQRELIADSMAELAMKIGLREAPFDAWKWDAGVKHGSNDKFLKYKSEIPERLCSQYLEYLTLSSRYRFREALGIYEKKAFTESHPALYAAAKEMDYWLEKREPRVIRYPALHGTGKVDFKMNQVITEVFKVRGFKKAKSPGVGKVPTYSRPFGTNELWLGFDRGSIRSDMSLYFGLKEPGYMLDIGNFFGVAQSWFRCRREVDATDTVDGKEQLVRISHDPTRQDAVDMVDRAIDLAEALLPYVLKHIEVTKLPAH